MTHGPWRALTGLIALLLFWAAPARAEWRRAESPNFIVYSTGSEARLRERILLLEDFDRLMRVITSVTAPPAANKLNVYIVSGLDDLQLLRPVARGVAGLYTATPDGIAAFVDGRAEIGDNEILFHEYAHHFMMQYAPGAYPAWYVEGFAEYFMTVRFRPRLIDIGNYSQGRAYAIVQGNWLPMAQILALRPQSLGGEQRSLFYAQSWLTVHYFYSTPERQAALARFLAAARAGDPVAALQSATGFTPDQFTAELRRYIRGGQIRYRRMERASADAPPPVAVTMMPRSADDLILFEAALRIGIVESNRAAYLQRIRTAAARHPEDPYAMRVLAHAEALHGDAAAADRLLDRLLAAAPGDAELMYMKGMRHLVAAEREGAPESEARAARTWFTRAHQADGNHFQTLFRYAQSLRGEQNFVSENTSNVLLLAHQLAPQVPSIALNAAALLISRGALSEATAILRPLAADPHDTGVAQAAQQMLERARSRSSRPSNAAEPTAEPDPAKPDGEDRADPPDR